jgi:phosphatidylglycerophosphate synthase
MKEILYKPFVKIFPIKEPNLITIFSLTSAIIFSITLVFNKYLAILFLILNIFFDGLDGEIARHYKKTTVFGEVLDAFCDRISDIFIFTALSFYFDDVFILIIFLISFLNTYLKARLETWTVGIKLRYLSIDNRLSRIILVILGLIIDKFFIYLIFILSIVGIFQTIHNFINNYKKY